ncbi:hypothetical protein Ddc_21311 [Ditylenchus destructor]|nr:hypothetical protein Ddc_21311 [Ditylenchus destructor]
MMFHSRGTLRLISYFRPLPIHFNQFSNNLRHFSVLGPNCQIKSIVNCEGTRNFSTSLTLKYFLIVSKEKLTNPIGVGPWLGYDPRDDDWYCDECGNVTPDGALLGKYNRNSLADIDSDIEYLRQWGGAVAQKIIANNKGYALVGFQTKTQEAKLKEQMIIAGFKNIECEF